ncbi:DUF4124 domain-containing protein [Halopseudomonas salegens]|uniref:DUF4124 domain-containing protein n=1 Tax=Halopseudomonas salegens TaxID=1434072 RepID=A0A1H2EAS7_9GAMM|nr:DUF4124 domain-containing protein [Halopseudomonas salegens]SDT92212.1 protein of unknown function [Halopseudomonas salegens]
MKNATLGVTLTLIVVAQVQAQPVYQCTGPNGEKVFSQIACPDGSAGTEVTVHNPPPSGDGELIPWGTPQVQSKPDTEPRARVTVVGEQRTCDIDLSAQEIRTAMVKKEVVVGMTTAEVKRALGQPLAINRSSRGDDQWVYPGIYLYIDKDGCLVSWN